MLIDARLGTLHEPLTGRRWDAAATLLRAQRRASLLRAAGVRGGARVFMHYGNKPEFFADLLATWCLGACAVPIDPRLTAFELEQLARAATPACSIWDGEVPQAARQVLVEAGVRLLDAGEVPRLIDEHVLRGGHPRLDDDLLLLFTSGTTGAPKGVVHTLRSLRARWNHQRERLGVAPFARTLCMVPTHFAWGLVGHCLYAWLSGLDLFLLPAFRQDVLLRAGALCDDLDITCLPSVPTMWRLALKTVAPPRKGTLQRVTCGTAPLTAALWAGVQQWSGARDVLNIYGITETGWLAGASLQQAAGAEALAGEPWGTVIRVLESASTEASPRLCPPGEVGHVWVQTPALMRGYFGRDDLTERVVTRGWFCTGDLGALDDRGRLFLRGRDRDMINVGGAKTYPEDIDAAVGRLDAVDDVCTFAFADPLHGESVAIAVVLKEPCEQRLGGVYRELKLRLATHQLPRRWYLLEGIPRSQRGKLDRRLVADHCGERAHLNQQALEKLAGAVVA